VATPTISFAARLSALANEAPDWPAVTCAGDTVTRAELERRANRLARDLANRGTVRGSLVTVALPNSVDWVVTTVACWKLGATPQPVSSHLPKRELDAIIELADPSLVVGIDPGAVSRQALPIGYQPPTTLSVEPLPDAVSPAWKAPTSGGSTGRPKLIVSGDPSVFDPNAVRRRGFEDRGCVLVPGPLYHNGPIMWTCHGLLAGSHVVVLPRFDAEATLAAIERHRSDIVYLVPTMMKRIWKLPEATRSRYDLSSLRIVWHMAEPCPAWLKEAWIEWLGPERIVELYGGTEGQVATSITGTEWLEHRGSVGRPIGGEIMICDADGNELTPGEPGEVWLRTARETPPYRYIGARPRQRDGGWESLGDIGSVDADGYLYLGDRMEDMILTGGANVYPAEVEAALQEHPAVRSCAVIGLPDDDRGSIVHAIIEADPVAVGEADLLEFLAERLVRYKLPRTIEYVGEPLRDDAGKVRRSELRANRLADPAGAS
jgi:bile acid-coenzyme A ligase